MAMEWFLRPRNQNEEWINRKVSTVSSFSLIFFVPYGGKEMNPPKLGKVKLPNRIYRAQNTRDAKKKRKKRNHLISSVSEVWRGVSLLSQISENVRSQCQQVLSEQEKSLMLIQWGKLLNISSFLLHSKSRTYLSEVISVFTGLLPHYHFSTLKH